MFGERGERGPTGDHGQEGARGRDGSQGKDGKDGIGAYAEPEEMIAEAIASNRLQVWDKRLLIMFALLVASIGMVFSLLDRELDQFRSAVVANCEQVNDGNRRVNLLLVKERRTDLALPISECPPIR